MFQRLRNALARWKSKPTTEEFTPQNELERRLYYAQRGEVSIAALIAELKRSQVVALFNANPTSTEGSRSSAQPLVLNGPDGAPMLAIFTSIERSKIWNLKQPEFCFGLQVSLDWLLRGTVSGVGLVINPGSTVGLEMPASGVAQLKADAGWA